MDTMQLTTESNRLTGQLLMLGYQDKLTIYKSLRQSLFKERFGSLLSALRTDDLSENDITAAVEEVRQERYASGEQAI
jgi:hypothetical protein